MESRRLGQASARDSNISRAGPGAVDPARPGPSPLTRGRSTRKNRWNYNIGIINITKRAAFQLFSLEVTEMSRIVIFRHAKEVTNRVFFLVR